MLNSPQKSDGRICIQQSEIDEDENGDYFYLKHLAKARYHRNHQLVNNIFNDVVVPDNRSVVTTSRLNLLRKQVNSLNIHQQKLDDELVSLEEQFQSKKRALLESSEKFANELKKRFSSNPVDEATYQKMYDMALEQLRKEHKLLHGGSGDQNQPLKSQENVKLDLNASQAKSDELQNGVKAENNSNNTSNELTHLENKADDHHPGTSQVENELNKKQATVILQHTNN